MTNIPQPVVRPGTIEEAVRLHATIPEFEPGYLSWYGERIRNRAHSVVLIAEISGSPAGYLVAYDDGGEVYVWMAGVSPAFRRHGALSALMAAVSAWALGLDYTALRLKTRNARREMLSFLVANEWLFCDFQLDSPLEESVLVARLFL